MTRKIEAALAANAVAAGPALVPALAFIVAAEVRLERERCIDICRARAELWTNTQGAKSPIPSAREEARARANEAIVLADLLASDSRYHTESSA